MGLNHKNTERLLVVENLKKLYPSRGVLGTKKEVIALQGVSFSIRSKSTLALVGESGSGKSTLAFCLACLEQATTGRIMFQDPARSLNPRFSALELVSEPLLVQGRLNKRKREDRARALLAQVGLPQEKALQGAEVAHSG